MQNYGNMATLVQFDLTQWVTPDPAGHRLPSALDPSICPSTTNPAGQSGTLGYMATLVLWVTWAQGVAGLTGRLGFWMPDAGGGWGRAHKGHGYGGSANNFIKFIF